MPTSIDPYLSHPLLKPQMFRSSSVSIRQQITRVRSIWVVLSSKPRFYLGSGLLGKSTKKNPQIRNFRHHSLDWCSWFDRWGLLRRSVENLPWTSRMFFRMLQYRFFSACLCPTRFHNSPSNWIPGFGACSNTLLQPSRPCVVVDDGLPFIMKSGIS